mmetsp:Transcript_13430/g.34250  ORF Transcript_13430/g.34250 Transcript_13430/m.34250 type:complete len:196 (+) Transcript_13430:93-680(+)
MFTARKKIIKEKGQAPSPLEQQVAQALFDLEVHATELRAELRHLAFLSAKEVEVSHNKKAVVLFVPYRLLQAYHRVQARLVRELEKKFSGKHVMIVAQRRILRTPSRKNRQKMQKRPRSRTLTAVHDSILEDVVYPNEIVGKRLRVRVDGSKLLKCYLDRKDQHQSEHKLEAFSAVYRKLTGKDISFLYPAVQQE